MKANRVRTVSVHPYIRVWVLGAILQSPFTIAADPQLRVDETQAKKAAIDKPAPAYPLTARQLKISGEVRVEAIVSENGSVEEVRILTGNLVLTKPAASAVKRWRFRPFLANGKPARAIVDLSFEFGSR